MVNDKARNAFGALAFLVTALVIAGVLSPYVPTEKETIANVILGNVLGWPMMVLAFYYGSSSGSKEKTAMMQKDDALDLTGAEIDR